MNTITTTRGLTVLRLGDGHTINLPARVRGVDVDTATALSRALEYETPEGIRETLKWHHYSAEAVGASQEMIEFGFVSWLAGFGDWSE